MIVFLLIIEYITFVKNDIPSILINTKKLYFVFLNVVVVDHKMTVSIRCDIMLLYFNQSMKITLFSFFKSSQCG